MGPFVLGRMLSVSDCIDAGVNSCEFRHRHIRTQVLFYAEAGTDVRGYTCEWSGDSGVYVRD
jgi:hypothetical protein